MNELKKGRFDERYLTMRCAEVASMCVLTSCARLPLPNGGILLTRKSCNFG